MRGHVRAVIAAAAFVVLVTACGGDDEAAPSPAPTGTHEITGRIMGPADKARDTVDQLNEQQDIYGE